MFINLIHIFKEACHILKKLIPVQTNHCVSTQSYPNMKCSMCKEEGHNKRSCKKITVHVSESNMEAVEAVDVPQPVKSQRKTNNLGLNTAKTQDDSYAEIEEKCPLARCSDGNHDGERMLPIRKFYLNKGGKGLQGACITCQTNRRANRIKRCREKFQGKTKDEVYIMYLNTYGQTKKCSKCNILKPPQEFPTSISMETGLHNHCIVCSIGNSQGNGGLRDFIFLPDKDGLKYKKKERCERCGGMNKLAVDHILPIAKGGTDCLSNKQTLCVHCNSKKNDTIDCVVQSEFLSERYKDPMLDFTNNTTLARILAKKVYEFRQSHIDHASIEQIRDSIKKYATKHNLGHNLARIIGKIAVIFNKC